MSVGPMPTRWSTQFEVFYSYLKDSDIIGPTANLELRSKILEKKYSQMLKEKTNFRAWVVSHCSSGSSVPHTSIN